jgi:hypothetical protein
MTRVCRHGGRIAMANWTPDGFIGQVFKTVGRHVPPMAGVASPASWGTRSRIAELFGPAAANIVSGTRQFMFRYRSPEHMLEVFRSYYGPILKAFAALDADRQQALAKDLLALMDEFNLGGQAGLVIPSDYLEVVVTLS